jgi:homoserine kinase type II
MPVTITDEELAEVLREYKLFKPNLVGSLEASNRNDNFLVEDSDSRRYVLRRYRRNLDDRRIYFQLRFQQELCKRGYPTSEVIETRTGMLTVASQAGPWALFSYVSGREFDFARLEQVAEAGRRLAEFHQVTSSIDLEEPTFDLNLPLREWWTNGKEQIRELGELFASRAADDLAFVRSWHESLLRDWPLDSYDALPSGWVHGDYHGRNMVFAGDEMRGLFDFDVVMRGTWGIDISQALFTFGREARGSFRIRPDAAQVLLQSYETVRPLLEEERAALPMAAVLNWAPNASYYEMIERDGEDPAAHFRRHVNNMRELQSEMERLRPVLLGS